METSRQETLAFTADVTTVLRAIEKVTKIEGTHAASISDKTLVQFFLNVNIGVNGHQAVLDRVKQLQTELGLHRIDSRERVVDVAKRVYANRMVLGSV